MPDSQITVELLDYMGTDLDVVNAARVSFDKESDWEFVDYWSEEVKPKLSDRDTKLIHYLAKHEHYSPFGHNFARFRIKAPVFVARQLGKHEYLRMNEVSRRYVDDEPEFYTPDVWRGRAKDKKQGSSNEEVTMLCLGVDGEQARPLPRLSDSGGKVRHSVGLANDRVLELYLEMLASGIAPEQARIVLPQSMMTQWWWSGSQDAFANMVNLRNKPDAQYETRLVAQQIDAILREVWPVSWEALTSDL